MPKSFTKKCWCHGTRGRVRKAEWKAMRKRKWPQHLGCSGDGFLKHIAFVAPYVPLLPITPVIEAL